MSRLHQSHLREGQAKFGPSRPAGVTLRQGARIRSPEATADKRVSDQDGMIEYEATTVRSGDAELVEVFLLQEFGERLRCRLPTRAGRCPDDHG
jgi:hypothetical protein